MRRIRVNHQGRQSYSTKTIDYKKYVNSVQPMYPLSKFRAVNYNNGVFWLKGLYKFNPKEIYLQHDAKLPRLVEYVKGGKTHHIDRLKMYSWLCFGSVFISSYILVPLSLPLIFHSYNLHQAHASIKLLERLDQDIKVKDLISHFEDLDDKVKEKRKQMMKEAKIWANKIFGIPLE